MKTRQKIKNKKQDKDQSICDTQDNGFSHLSRGANHMQILFKLHMMNTKLLSRGSSK